MANQYNNYPVVGNIGKTRATEIANGTNPGPTALSKNNKTNTSGEKINNNTNDDSINWDSFLNMFNKAVETANSANELSKQSTEEANKYNAEQAQINREFQERMRNTEVQARVKDLIAAGINPILGYNGGASSPSGSQASASTYAGQQANLNSNIATIGYIMEIIKDFKNSSNSGKILADLKETAEEITTAVKDEVKTINKKYEENKKWTNENYYN